MAQRYLPAARDGDKRVIVLDGEPLGAVLRVPREDEHRGNIHVGGSVAEAAVDDRDREICARLAPRLRADGLYFVGLDVIGDYLTEVNVTSPTGIQEIDRLDGVVLEAKVIDFVEARARVARSLRRPSLRDRGREQVAPQARPHLPAAVLALADRDDAARGGVGCSKRGARVSGRSVVRVLVHVPLRSGGKSEIRASPSRECNYLTSLRFGGIVHRNRGHS